MAFQDNFKEYLSKKQPTDEELTAKETQELQEAIDNSKLSASLEEQKREANRQAEEILKRAAKPGTSAARDDIPFSPKQWSKGAKSPGQVPATSTVCFFTEEDTKPTMILDIVYHPPMFDDAVDPTASLRERVKQLAFHIDAIKELQARQARKSLRRAPIPSVISPKKIIQEEMPNLPEQEIYISRSGRQSKRKIYTETRDGESDSFSQKKNKSEDPFENMPYESPFVPYTQATSELKWTESDEITEEKEETGQQQSKEVEKTLPSADILEQERIFEDSSVAENRDDDETFVRERVSPPLPMRGRGRGRKGSKEESKKRVMTKAAQKVEYTPTSSPATKRPNINKSPEDRAKPKGKSKAKEHAAPVPSTSAAPEEGPCPVCNKMFPLNELAAHASDCGDPVPERRSTRKSPSKKFLCQFCNHVSLTASEFESHYKKCVSSKPTNV
ncbi:uncharacterized protein LOC135126222 isoform X2 [Zophobas morio]|uniref:uncharacterized protein LOC135126222 isoform X2 n=1 Tax=Zophobas morio TaxID=2755281 RepID=UPI0030832BFB